MLIPKSDQILPKADYSKELIRFMCDCGNEITTMWTSFRSGKAKSCGKCKFFLWKREECIKYGLMTLVTPIQEINKLTDVVLWRCDCGNQKNATVINISAGKIRSCGCLFRRSKNSKKGTIHTRDEWKKLIPGIIDLNLPEKWSSGTNQIFAFTCECRKSFFRKFNRFQLGKSKCGSCDMIQLQSKTVFNNLTYMGSDIQIKASSTKKCAFSCICGKTIQAKIGSVISGKKKKCGDCNSINELRFGNLTVNDKILSRRKNSDKKVKFLCDCGQECILNFNSVANGYTRSCGHCTDVVRKWWANSKDALKTSRFPILRDDILISFLKPLNDINGPDDFIPFTCPICKSIHETRFKYIRNGESLTCGCKSGQTSVAQYEIANVFIEKGIESIIEYSVNGLKYDIFIPSANLLIEYHGLKWHSMQDAKYRDLKKFQNAINFNFDLICIFEDEWRYDRSKVIGLLKNRIRVTNPKCIRPSKCEIKKMTLNESDSLYSRFHYIGPCKSNINYGAMVNEELMACMSFKRPTRQSSHDWELVRMVADPSMRIHGIWSKLMKQFIFEYSPKSIVSFSDNRLFNGKVYEKIGFKYDGDIPPDYYWCKNKRRYHKSGLRKPKGYPGTEVELRESEGYKKIWDLGKKRWVWHW